MLSKQAKIILQVSAVILVFGLLLFACERRNGFKDLKHFVDQLKQAGAKRLNSSKLPPIKMPAPVTYQADTLRPPFGELLNSNKNTVLTRAQEANPLLAYSLSVLKFVGTLTQHDTMYAFILAPNGIIYQVEVGDLIGDHQGKVVNIQEGQLDIMEQGSDDRKAGLSHIVTLQLKDEQ